MKKAFTLIELLVVIAIIAILAAMLLPALQQARERAHGASCINNQKGLGTVATTYTDDNRGFWPAQDTTIMSGTASENASMWKYFTWIYCLIKGKYIPDPYKILAKPPVNTWPDMPAYRCPSIQFLTISYGDSNKIWAAQVYGSPSIGKDDNAVGADYWPGFYMNMSSLNDLRGNKTGSDSFDTVKRSGSRPSSRIWLTDAGYYDTSYVPEMHSRCAFQAGSGISKTGCRLYPVHAAKANILAHDAHVATVAWDELNSWHIPKVKNVDDKKQVFSTYVRTVRNPEDPKEVYSF